MFDIGWAEIILIMLVGLLVIGPKEFPRVIRYISKIMGQIRNIRQQLQYGWNKVQEDMAVSETEEHVMPDLFLDEEEGNENMRHDENRPNKKT